ncbi:calcium-transporting ATPase 12, plasma membrane-type-like [Malania oleifera]|uniref:calcium-transporting ATPase 12, plasma membrane-type-like n=1 Tax=Malania oleifera TaxID=397392 RepID=UPI0025AE4BFC|nr:calcium-transporting ATPase 12, plasma membrane-type-like [Malania oleifera]
MSTWPRLLPLQPHHSNAALVVNIPAANNLTKPQRRWRFAFAAIYSIRALLSTIKSLTSTSHAILDINSSPPHHFSNVAGTTKKRALAKMAKEKNLDDLKRLGGVGGVVEALKTNADNGIHGGEEDVQWRAREFGSNEYIKPPPKGFFHFLWEAFKDVTIIILLMCATLSLGFGIKENGPREGWYEGGSIYFAVFLVIVVSAGSNYRQSKQFEELSKVSGDIQVDVVRNGRRHHISISNVVVGDVVSLNIGDQVPADGLFLTGHSLRIDESSMTGESEQVEIEHDHPFLLSGAKVVDGYGRMVVTAVGTSTTWGEMMSSIGHDSAEQTPLQARLNKLTSAIGKVGLVVASLVLVAMLIRYFTGSTKDENGRREYNGRRTGFDEIMNAMVRVVAAAVTIVVVAIPEGLPLAVTLTLAYSMKRMMVDHALVRRLSACETMGSATTICTDKTGTLTLNQMKVTAFWLGKESISADAYKAVSPSIVELLRQAAGLNTTGSIYKTNSGSEPEFSGSPTEKALLFWAVQELNLDVDELKQKYEILNVKAFNSEKKRSGVLLKYEADDKIHVHWKGAAELLLERCSYYYDSAGSLIPIHAGDRKEIVQNIRSMAAEALRCIAFAHKEIRVEDDDHLNYEGHERTRPLDEEDLAFLGVVGIKDPCRPFVKHAVLDCQNAGVDVKMVTGDNIFTAIAIALECGILESNSNIKEKVVEGVEFRNYSHEERMKRIRDIRVMARSSPMDKLLMVKCLKQSGNVVAVTGDGTNDAPALKEADVGLAMGIQGTEVAKESSDIIILDDNFKSVVTVLKWGRCVYNSIQKFIQFQLTVNVAALVINLVAACSNGEVPLTAVQLLWVNLIMDTLGALALATERPTDELMKKAPVGRTEPLITNIMWRNLIFQAFYQIIILLTLQYKGTSIFKVGKKVKDTLIFNTFVLCQVFNEFNARRLERKNVFKGIHRNQLFVSIIGITIVLQVVMVEFLQRFADTERLSWSQWGVCIALASISWPLGLVVKYIPVGEKPFMSYLRCKRFKISV